MFGENVKVLYSASEIENAVEKLADKLNKNYGEEEELIVICVLKGAAIFGADLVRHLKMPVKIEYVKLSSYGADKVSSGKVNAVDINLPDLNGKNVLIVEDIIDTGHTAVFLMNFINKNFHTKSLKFCAFLDKKIRREVEADADYFCFEVGDKFVVGYGLDYDGNYRQLPYLGYI